MLCVSQLLAVHEYCSSAELQESRQQRAAYIYIPCLVDSGSGWLGCLSDAMTVRCCVGSARPTIESVRDRERYVGMDR